MAELAGDELDSQVLDAILAGRRSATGAMSWQYAPSYILRHAVEHAQRANRVDELLSDADFLIFADPRTLTPLLPQARSATARTLAQIYRTSLAFHRAADTFARRDRLALDAMRYGHRELAVRFRGPDVGPLAAEWATGGQLCSSLSDTLHAHAGAVYAICLVTRADRPVAVTGGADGMIRMWDLCSGESIGPPRTGHEGPVTALAVGRHQDRIHLVSGGADHTVRRWDLSIDHPESGVVLGKHTATVSTVLWPQDREPTVLTSGYDGLVATWHLDPAAAPATAQSIRVHDGLILAADCFSRHGDRHVAVALDDGAVQVWNLATGEPFGAPIHGHDRWTTAVRFVFHRGRHLLLTGSDDHTVRGWDLETGDQVVPTLHGHRGPITAVRFVARVESSLVLTTSYDHTARLWDLDTGRGVGTYLIGHTHVVSTAAVWPPSSNVLQAVTGGWDGTIRVWDVPEDHDDARPTGGHVEPVTAIARYRVEGRDSVVTVGDDQTLRRWDLASGRPLGPPKMVHNIWTTAVATAHLDGRTVALTGSADYLIGVWDLERGLPVRDPVSGHSGTVFALAGQRMQDRLVVASASDDQTVRVWDVADPRRPLRHVLRGHRGSVTAVAFASHEAGQILLSGGHDGMVHLWDPLDGGRLASVTAHAAPVTSIATTAVRNRSAFITSSEDGTVRFWDTATLSELGDLPHPAAVQCADAARLGSRSYVFTGGDDAVLRVWDADTGIGVDSWAMPAGIRTLSASADGTVVVGSGWEVIAMTFAAGGTHP